MTQNNANRQIKELTQSFNQGLINSKQLSKRLKHIKKARQRTTEHS